MSPEDIRKLTSNYNQPVVFKNVIKWNMITWSLENWCAILKDENFLFRKIPIISTEEPIWENLCEKVLLKMSDFNHIQNQVQVNLDYVRHSLYFDYKYMKDYFSKFPEVNEKVQWADVGYPEITGDDSTIWIGSAGSHTLCHKDTYGYNLVAQIYGQKEWILFPPETDLKATRVPFEESTIFSNLNLFYPQIERFKNITGARLVVLNPGDMLFVPHDWWHYVENLNTAISINTWIPVGSDYKRRVEECLISIFIQGMTNNYSSACKVKIEHLLNSSSEFLTQVNATSLLSFSQEAIKEYLEEKSKIDDKDNIGNVNFEELIQTDENVNLVETLSNDAFQHLLRNKKLRYNFVKVDHMVQYSPEDIILDNIINSFCNEENISKVADDFIKNNV